MTSERSFEVVAEEEQTVELLAPSGLGFGKGTIGVEAQLRSGELSQEAYEKGIEIIENDPEVFVPVDADAQDDGCGDGRPADRVFQLIDSSSGEVTEFNKSRLRAKVFGGGLVVASSMWRTIAGVPDAGETILGDRMFIADELAELGITFGAHTDNHASGENCGCGAIDKYPDISANILTFRSEITATLQALYGDTFEDNQASIDAVFDRYEQLKDNDYYFSNGSGKRTKELLLDRGAVIKELADNHLEDYIVVNDIEGTTFNQRAFDQKMQEAGMEGAAQAFVVDTWRGRMYADALVNIASKQRPDLAREQVQKEAYADFLIRTLATAGTLTAGDLPVFGRRNSSKQDYALVA